MSNAQLTAVLSWEQDKEDKAARDFQMAQQFVDQHKLKLQGLEQYRMDYMRQIQSKGNDGLGATSFSQHQGFVAKLDKACEMQRQVIHNAVLAAEQRKQKWLKQQTKRKAVDTLLDKKRKAQFLREEKQEQALLDEVALQRYIRSKTN